MAFPGQMQGGFGTKPFPYPNVPPIGPVYGAHDALLNLGTPRDRAWHDPAYAFAIVHSYCKTKLMRGKTAQDLHMKLEALEVQVSPHFASTFVETRKYFNLRESRVFVLRTPPAATASSSSSSSAAALRRTATNASTASSVVTTRIAPAPPARNPEDTDEPPPPPYSSEDPEPESTRILQEQLASQAPSNLPAVQEGAPLQTTSSRTESISHNRPSSFTGGSTHNRTSSFGSASHNRASSFGGDAPRPNDFPASPAARLGNQQPVAQTPQHTTPPPPAASASTSGEEMTDEERRVMEESELEEALRASRALEAERLEYERVLQASIAQAEEDEMRRAAEMSYGESTAQSSAAGGAGQASGLAGVGPTSAPFQQPGGYQQPPGGFQQPGGYQQPQGGFQQPGGYQQPQSGFQQPGGYQQPQGVVQQPVGYQQPPGGLQRPTGYHQPGGLQPPGDYLHTPGAFQQPSGGFQQPPGGVQQPSGASNSSPPAGNGHNRVASGSSIPPAVEQGNGSLMDMLGDLDFNSSTTIEPLKPTPTGAGTRTPSGFGTGAAAAVGAAAGFAGGATLGANLRPDNTGTPSRGVSPQPTGSPGLVPQGTVTPLSPQRTGLRSNNPFLSAEEREALIAAGDHGDHGPSAVPTPSPSAPGRTLPPVPDEEEESSSDEWPTDDEPEDFDAPTGPPPGWQGSPLPESQRRSLPRPPSGSGLPPPVQAPLLPAPTGSFAQGYAQGYQNAGSLPASTNGPTTPHGAGTPQFDIQQQYMASHSTPPHLRTPSVGSAHGASPGVSPGLTTTGWPVSVDKRT